MLRGDWPATVAFETCLRRAVFFRALARDVTLRRTAFFGALARDADLCRTALFFGALAPGADLRRTAFFFGALAPDPDLRRVLRRTAFFGAPALDTVLRRAVFFRAGALDAAGRLAEPLRDFALATVWPCVDLGGVRALLPVAPDRTLDGEVVRLRPALRRLFVPRDERRLVVFPEFRLAVMPYLPRLRLPCYRTCPA